ncbi:laccase [Salvia divinorum]|uniref:Laccase n=1 Tax=Salvia divinorum TaxID=28513 RepID=A0ABD1G8V5_SALDI
MGTTKTMMILQILVASLLHGGVIYSHATTHYNFEVVETVYNRLCSNKTIMTVNGQFPGPTIHVTEGETIVVVVANKARQNITIHWHGVKQPRYPWSDGPEYITQCPIRPGTNFSQKIEFSDEIGTLWWHAHSDWSRATVHGAVIIHPKKKDDYPFPVPHAEIPIILGEWWKSDVQEVLSEFLKNGGEPNISDAFLINGQPGDLYPCSRKDTFKITVDHDKRYLIRLINTVMNTIMFFKIGGHNVTVVGTDGAYLKPFTTNYVAISPGQTLDVLLLADQKSHYYYMAVGPYSVAGTFDNTTTTALLEYRTTPSTLPPSSPRLPLLPESNNTLASADFTRKFKTLSLKNRPINVPTNPSTKLFFTLSMNTLPCPNATCLGPFGDRFSTSINNLTFDQPKISILEAYYKGTNGVYSGDFPSRPPLAFNYTEEFVSRELWFPANATKVRYLDYNSTVEIVFQGTNTVRGVDHPMHLHGYSFYVVGSGFGDFDEMRDPRSYNLVNPPLMNTIAVPVNGWTTIRFRADNPGVWLLHCHLERHLSWGMMMVFITKNGKGPSAQMDPPPPDFPRC